MKNLNTTTLVVISLIALHPAAAESSKVATDAVCEQLNNQAVGAMNAHKWRNAIARLNEALKLNPTYSHSRENLIMSHNQYGSELEEQHKYREALSEYHQALNLGPSKRFDATRTNAETLNHVNNAIRLLGKNPNDFRDRVALGDQARAANDLAGALAEYQAALELKNDPVIHTKIADLCRLMGKKERAAAQ